MQAQSISTSREYIRQYQREYRKQPKPCKCWRGKMGVKFSCGEWICEDCLEIEADNMMMIEGGRIAQEYRRRSEMLHETAIEAMWKERRGEEQPIVTGDSLKYLKAFGYEQVA